MKKLISILILCALTMAASAQAYQAPEVKISSDKVKVNGEVYYTHVVLEKQTLYSICKAYKVTPTDIYRANTALGIEANGIKAGQILLIPEVANEPIEPQQDTVITFPQQPIPDPIPAVPDSFVLDMPSVVKLAMILPLNAKSSNPNSNYLDFYSGALLAARKLGNEGVAIDITVFDTSDSTTPITTLALSDADVIIGPVSTKDITSVLKVCPAGKHIISPLDPRTVAMTEASPVIQASATNQDQIREMISWLRMDLVPGDTVVVVTETGGKLSENSRMTLGELHEQGILYSTLSYDILQGLLIIDSFESRCAAGNGTTRFIIASDNEAMVNDALRNINLLKTKEHNVALYSTSRIRSYETIDTEAMYGANLHMTAAYYVNYTDPDVKEFVLAYRALYNCEPNQFAFHGYDTLLYFTDICTRFGRNWNMVLHSYLEQGLQTDFRFEASLTPGKQNKAVRRVLFRPDMTVSIVR